MTNFSANFLTNCSFGEQFANLNELYIWYARTEQLWLTHVKMDIGRTSTSSMGRKISIVRKKISENLFSGNSKNSRLLTHPGKSRNSTSRSWNF